MNRLACVLLLLLLAGCQSSDYPGYTRLEEGVHFRLLTLGDDERAVEDASHISLRIHAYDTLDQLIWMKSYRRIAKSALMKPSPAWRSALQPAHEGDSLSLIGVSSALGVPQLFQDSTTDLRSRIRLECVVVEALTEDEFRQRDAEDRMRHDLELREQLQLNRVLDSLSIGDSDQFEGVYFKILESGAGPAVVKGAYVSVHYQLRLMNGRLLDDTQQADMLEYEIGRPDQVLPGFALGMANLREGDEAIFVIPSRLAFGERGSTSGIVPPYSILIYHVQLASVSI